MSVPLPRSKRNEENLDQLSTQLYGRKRADAIRTDICVKCGRPKGQFRDEISEREYTISGLCQACQDSIFEEEDDMNEQTINHEGYTKHYEGYQVRKMLSPEAIEVWVSRTLVDRAAAEADFDLGQILSDGLARLAARDPESLEPNWDPSSWSPFSLPTNAFTAEGDVMLVRQPAEHPGEFTIAFVHVDECF